VFHRSAATFDNAQAGYAGVPDAFLAIASMPDVESRIQTLLPPKFAAVRVAVRRGRRGQPKASVEIRLPAGLVQPSRRTRPKSPSGNSIPARSTGLSPTGGLIDVRLRPHPPDHDHGQRVRSVLGADRFRPLLFSEAPVKALHNFHRCRRPTSSRNDEWLRHTVGPWLPNQTGPLDGLIQREERGSGRAGAPVRTSPRR
jgi:hypothetical protein